MKNVLLNNGVNIPAIGFGTWTLQGERGYRAFRQAIECGFRHFDTAESYDTEIELGRAIRDSGVAREEFFITSKLPGEFKAYEIAKATLEQSLERLGMDYLDLYIIHAPWPWEEQDSPDWAEGNLAAWHAMSEGYKAQKVRAIGLSNFSYADIERIWDRCEIKPMLNQIRLHIGHVAASTVRYCKEHGIAVSAWSPLGGAPLRGKVALPEWVTVKTYAKKYGVTPQQLCLRFAMQYGDIVIGRTGSEKHMLANLAIENFTISDADMLALSQIDPYWQGGEKSLFA